MKPFLMPKITSSIDHAVCLSLIMLIISGIALSLFGSISRYVIVIGSFSVFTLFLLNKRISRNHLLIILFLLFWYLLSMMVRQQFYEPNFYIAPIAALAIIHTDEKLLYRYILGFLFIQLGLEIFETITESFLYYPQIKFDADLIIDEKITGGASGDFRAKGLLEGPITVGATCILISTIYHRRFLIIFLCLLCSLLASARLGILMTGGLCVFYFYSRIAYNVEFKVRIFLILFLLFVVFGMIFFSLDQIYSSESGLGMALNTDSPRNIARIYYWTMGVLEIRDFSVFELIFGKPGYFRPIYENSPESAWFNMILEAGCITLVVYLYSLFRTLKADIRFLIPQLIVFLSGVIVVLCASISTCVLFWIMCYTFQKQKKNAANAYGNYNEKR